MGKDKENMEDKTMENLINTEEKFLRKKIVKKK